METLQQQKEQQKVSSGNLKNNSQPAVSFPSRTIVHAKLEMTEPGDHDEQEADAVANDIVSGGKIRRKISNGGGSGISVSPQVESLIAQLQGGGHAMPEGLRNMMGNGFGHDFSQVRLHTDSQAAEMSSSISARAFTHGNDIYFNRGQFSPNTAEGQRLVAHELTHVVQGTGKVGRKEKPQKKSAVENWADYYNSVNPLNVLTFILQSESFDESLFETIISAYFISKGQKSEFEDALPENIPNRDFIVSELDKIGLFKYKNYQYAILEAAHELIRTHAKNEAKHVMAEDKKNNSQPYKTEDDYYIEQLWNKYYQYAAKAISTDKNGKYDGDRFRAIGTSSLAEDPIAYDMAQVALHMVVISQNSEDWNLVPDFLVSGEVWTKVFLLSMTAAVSPIAGPLAASFAAAAGGSAAASAISTAIVNGVIDGLTTAASEIAENQYAEPSKKKSGGEIVAKCIKAGVMSALTVGISSKLTFSKSYLNDVVSSAIVEVLGTIISVTEDSIANGKIDHKELAINIINTLEHAILGLLMGKLGEAARVPGAKVDEETFKQLGLDADAFTNINDGISILNKGADFANELTKTIATNNH